MENKDELKQLEAKRNKEFLKIEDILIITNLIQFVSIFIIIPSIHEIPDFTCNILMVISLVVFLFSVFYAVKIEAEAGYYECRNCGHKYVATYKQVLFAPHVGKTRYMECPECHKKSWQHKAFSK